MIRLCLNFPIMKLIKISDFDKSKLCLRNGDNDFIWFVVVVKFNAN